MSRLDKKEVLGSLERLLQRINEGKVEVFAHEKDALMQVIEQYGTKERPMSAYFDLENYLYDEKQTKKSIEIKSAMLWGGLWVVHQMGCISWDTMREMYGEFMSKHMGVR